MQIHVLVGAFSFCIFGLGLFLGAAVRPVLVTAMTSEPVLIGPILTSMFSRYNVVALVLSVLSLALEIAWTHSVPSLLLAGALVLILALKLPIDKVIQRREGATQVRGVGAEGKRLDRLHKAMEAATLVVLVLSLGLFVLNLLPAR